MEMRAPENEVLSMIGDEDGSIFAGAARTAIAAHGKILDARSQAATTRRDTDQMLEYATKYRQMTVTASEHAANAAGLQAQAEALKKALLEVAPNHPLLQQIGVNNKGVSVTNLTTLYYSAFDTSIKGSLGNVDPKNHRSYRVK